MFQVNSSCPDSETEVLTLLRLSTGTPVAFRAAIRFSMEETLGQKENRVWTQVKKNKSLALLKAGGLLTSVLALWTLAAA